MDRKIPLVSLGWDLGALSSSTKRVLQGRVRAGNKTCGEQREQMRSEGLEGSVFEAAVPAVVATWEENGITRLLQDTKHGNADELS